MTYEHAAFLSYSHRDAAWVEVLHQNLESALQALGHEPPTIFRDDTDLGPGRSWVGGLQRGLDRAPRVILVATPESVASPRVEDEWESFIARYPDWRQGRILVVYAVEGPLPPFLESLGLIDFIGHDDRKYRRALQELIGALSGHRDRRNLPKLPTGLTLPPPPSRAIPSKLRNEVVDWLADRLRKSMERAAIAQFLGPSAPSLDGHSSARCAASALIVGYTGNDDPVKALRRMLDVLAKNLAEDLPREVDRIAPMRKRLKAIEESGAAGGGLETLWLEKVVRDHGRLERYFQEDADVDMLLRVYVSLNVAPEERVQSGERAAEDGVASLDAQGPVELQDLLALDRSEYPWATTRWIVLGDPGAGKTTLLRHLAASLAQTALVRREVPRWVPVYESLPTWLRKPEAIAPRLERRLRRAGHKAEGFAALCGQWAKDGRLLLLLDGLDEVPREDRSEAEELIRELTALWPDTPMVVASRPIGYRPPGTGFTEVRLLPLDRDRRRELLARWLGRKTRTRDEEKADQALEILAEDRSLWELSGNPLYLTLMAMLIEMGTEPERNRARLYDQIFDLLMSGKHRADPADPDSPAMQLPGVTRSVLQRLAHDMTLDNRPTESLGDLEVRLLQEDLDLLRSQMERIPRWRRRLANFFTDLAERTGILGPHDGDEANWRYWHRTFREALAAERLEEVMKREGTEAVLDRAREITREEDASRWAEPYALLTGRVDEPDNLVRKLVAANRSLGLRALSSAQTLKSETVVEILGLTGEVEERANVYREMPRLLEDGRAVLDLVEGLRRKTRDGNDLFWLDWVGREVGRREADLAGEVEALLDRFFDHIPAPPVETFTEVETVRDGRVPLWCKIPAGEFWMGTPDGTAMGGNHERPCHRVEIRSPFWMAAVPVTQAQYACFDPNHASFDFQKVSAEEGGQHPVTQITWWAAVSFCRWLGQVLPETSGARLPSEAEWEYACRAGRGTGFWKGEGKASLRMVGWFDENSGWHTHRVGELMANPWDLYDVHGNVWEWTLSPWVDYADRQDGAVEDPAILEPERLIAADPEDSRVVRGGSCAYDASDARSAARVAAQPWNLRWLRGFRVVLPPAVR